MGILCSPWGSSTHPGDPVPPQEPCTTSETPCHFRGLESPQGALYPLLGPRAPPHAPCAPLTVASRSWLLLCSCSRFSPRARIRSTFWVMMVVTPCTSRCSARTRPSPAAASVATSAGTPPGTLACNTGQGSGGHLQHPTCILDTPTTPHEHPTPPYRHPTRTLGHPQHSQGTLDTLQTPQAPQRCPPIPAWAPQHPMGTPYTPPEHSPYTPYTYPKSAPASTHKAPQGPHQASAKHPMCTLGTSPRTLRHPHDTPCAP